MQTLTTDQLEVITGGAGDSLARDLGQFLGGASGWIRANLGTYFILGPAIGGLVATGMGMKEAAR